MLQPMLAAILVALGIQRTCELAYARKTARHLRATQAVPIRPDGYPLLVAVHVLWFVALAVEGAASPWTTPRLLLPGVLLFAVGEALRASSMIALGPRWNTRVWIVPGAPLVRRGPYRWLRHPIYVGVVLELAGLPLAFGCWGTLLGIGLLHAVALTRRIRIEAKALDQVRRMTEGSEGRGLGE